MKAKFVATALIGLMAVSTAAQASFWDKVSGVLGTAGSVLGAVGTVTGTSNSGKLTAPMAKITEQQKQAIRDNIQPNTDDKFLNEYILQAKDNAAYFLEVMSCQNDDSNINAGRVLSSGYFATGAQAIIPRTKYHPVDQCMTVTSVGNWSAPLRDTLKFEVMFSSDVSGEAAKRLITMEKENGKWLVDHVLAGY